MLAEQRALATLMACARANRNAESDWNLKVEPSDITYIRHDASKRNKICFCRFLVTLFFMHQSFNDSVKVLILRRDMLLPVFVPFRETLVQVWIVVVSQRRGIWPPLALRVTRVVSDLLSAC